MSYKGKSLYLDFGKLPRPDRRFTLGRILAKGICARIFEATDHERGGQRVAIKVLTNLVDNLDAVEEEYRIFKDLSRHDNFPGFYGAFLNKFDKEEKDELWLVMEYCSGGSLGDFVTNMRRNHRTLSESLIGYILRELVNALCYLHMNHIMHRDIKARNVLLTEDGRVKLADFGFSRHLKTTLSKRKTAIGSPHWMAPEVISSSPDNFQSQGLQDIDVERNGYDNRCDVWSLGITAIELADGEPPLWNLHPMRALFQIVHNPPPELKSSMEWSNNFRDFIAECLVKNPDHRPVAMELMGHPFIQEVPEDDGMFRNQLKTLISKQTTSHDLDMPSEMIMKDGKIKVEPNGPFKRMYPDDLAALDLADEDRVLLTLGNRFSRGQFQTYAGGNILIIINPQKERDIYDDEHHKRYMFKALTDEEPHIFGIVDKAWQDMLHHKEHQNIILSGERNSGKSFNFHQVIGHLCRMAKGNAATADRIEQLPAILDCFGNAATDGNANSSRHVRYVELTFTESGKLSGAIVTLYLLEKWRISGALSKSNRNYHIFYYIYYGLKKEGALKRYLLDFRTQFRYLPVGETEAELSYYLNGYAKLKEYLRFWDMENQEQEFIFQTIAAILLLGQVDFDTDREGGAVVANPDILNKVATLLSVESAKLGWALCNQSTIVEGTMEASPRTTDQAEEFRDALARGIYSRLVDWLVNNLNINLCLSRKVFGEKYTMGVLDPPGFDQAPRKNSFEQLLFNIVNEQLAYHYNQSVFEKEIRDYKDEGIQMEDFDFKDNHHTLNAMLSKPDGLLSIIDIQSRTATADLNVLAESLERSLAPEHLTIDVDDGNISSFTVQHFAGNVRYRMAGIFGRNRDFLPAELIEVMRNSTNARLASLFINKLTRTGQLTTDPSANNPPDGLKRNEAAPNNKKNKGINTVSQGEYSQTRQMQTQIMRTRHSLFQLLRSLARGSPHFVRCIRRGATMSPTTPGLDKKYLTEQIRSFSLVEAIKIRQRGYTQRVPFEEFLRRYQYLAFDFEETVEMTSDNCRLLFLRLRMDDGYMLSKSKVFMKYYTEQYLSRLYEEHVRKIIKVQAIIRAVMAKLRKRRGGSSSSSRARRNSNTSAMSQDEAAVTIQKKYRGYVSTRKELGVGPRNGSKAKRFECASIQEEAANTIQYFWRKWKGKSIFQQLLLYRGLHQQQLTYFCQQVHIYNQEYCGSVRKTAAPLDVGEITQEERRRALSTQAKPGAAAGPKKLPLLLRNRHFLDTTFMCLDVVRALDKSKPAPKETPTPADRALKSPPSPAPRASPIKSPSPVPPIRSIKSPTSPTPVASLPTSPLSPIQDKISAFQESSVNNNKPNVQINGWNGRTQTPQQPSYGGLSKPVAPKTNNHSSSMVGAADHRQIAKEIERKAAEFGKSNSEDNGPFNFQAMLRRTDHKRGSMKRLKGQQESSDTMSLMAPATNGKTSNTPVIYQSPKPPSSKSHQAPLPNNNVESTGKQQPGFINKAPVKYKAPTTPTKIELAPGLVIEGEEADL